MARQRRGRPKLRLVSSQEASTVFGPSPPISRKLFQYELYIKERSVSDNKPRLKRSNPLRTKKSITLRSHFLKLGAGFVRSGLASEVDFLRTTGLYSFSWTSATSDVAIHLNANNISVGLLNHDHSYWGFSLRCLAIE